MLVNDELKKILNNGALLISDTGNNLTTNTVDALSKFMRKFDLDLEDRGLENWIPSSG